MPLDPDKPHTSQGTSKESEDSVDPSEETVRKRIRESIPNSDIGSTPQSSPPQFVTVEELMETAKGVTNMALAHEIVVNGDFKIKQTELPEGSLEKRVRDIVHKAFWDCLEAQLNEDPPTYDHAIILVGEIKEILLSFLLPGHTRLRNQINEVLDLDLIKQEAENEALDISKIAEFIIGMMGTLCAPVRDEAIKKLQDIKEIVPLFRALFSVLDLMKMDMANFAISSIRPHLMQQSVEYERKTFQKFIEKQPNSLDFVTKWLQEAVGDLSQESCRDSSSDDAAPALCPLHVQNHAYLKLLKWDHSHRPFPETVLMDQTRFQEMQQELTQLTIIATVLLVIHSSAGTAVSSLSGFMDKIKTIIKVLLTDMQLPSFNLSEALAMMAEKICAEANNSLSQHGFPSLTAEKATVLRGQIQAAANADNHIHKLIDSRIHTFLKSYLASSNHKSFPALPGGLGPIQKELEEIAVKYVRLVNYNKMVYSPYYDAVLGNILKKEESHLTVQSEKV
ncbi:T-complex protein 11-like protein 1 [Microcaecilia unicolor]|uniref:T-complex protein 11-like protein 1 n=1 Tax=Microcaecilia unicolor TaxID=1415580 RepID=A0A6P7Y104_9AMPH|nr:T-complex protein 11-like protein 1 [Microcaecilia unicolor]XP_030056500.1 T-complex protein 11-like protein 1 [Microcaecilia unicolor]XP_030056501.1 T-complex protein 11-like protein 1 [Microcaecilia unicolor]XP_030056502.1 T-complex protein 11-like protein 1 [Microcaecilia unicolor]